MKPAPQGVQTDDSGWELHEPGEQGSHTEGEEAPVWPEKVPGPHAVHVSAPAALHEPAPHIVSVPEVEPDGQA